MVADIDLGQNGMSRCCAVSQVDAPVLVSKFVRGSARLWVCFGPLEGYALWLECFEVVQDGLEEGEFRREFGEFGGDAIDTVGDGSAVRVDDVVLLLW